MPAVCETYLSMFVIITSAGQQHFIKDHKWTQESGDFSQYGRYLEKK